MMLACVTTIGVLAVAPPAAAIPGVLSDGDGDGLDDGLEDTLASRFFPWIWFDSGENYGCTEPATPWNLGTALARVRPHPQDGGKIAIGYTVLFRRDCGDLWGFSSHHGDVEPFSLTLAPNGGCPDGWGVTSLKTISHQGTWAEHVDERWIGNSCSFGRLAGGSRYDARIYSAENKHGLYAWDSTCDAGVGGLDNCSESYTREYTVFNVGEDHARRIDELGGVQFPGEYAWTPVLFRGSLGGGSGDAGYVRDKLLGDHLLAPAGTRSLSAGCADRTKVWHENPGRAATVRAGSPITLSAVGVAPGSTVTYRFVSPTGAVVATHETKAAGPTCAVPSSALTAFAPGSYRVEVSYTEGPLRREAVLADLVITA